MSQKLNWIDLDREITNKAIQLTNKQKLVELFGEKENYEIPEYLRISDISNKAFYKLNDEELYYLNARASVGYKALNYFYTKKAEEELGFQFNSKFGIEKNDNFNLQSLSDFEDDDVEQKLNIPLKQTLVNKIVQAPKYKVEIEASPKSKLSVYGRTAEYFLCEVDGQVLPIVKIERQMPIHNTDPLRYSQSISIFALLKGNIPFFISRLDFDPFNKHTNRLENGQIATSKIKSRGTHQHIYSERFAILVPTNKRVMHCDAETYDFIATFDQAKEYVKKQVNLIDYANKEYESVFKNDLKKAQKQKKYTPNKKRHLTNHELDSFNM